MWRVVAITVGVSLAAKILVTGYDKFVVYVARSMSLPTRVAESTAILVLASEAVAVSLLLWPKTREMGWIVAASLLVAFSIFHLFSMMIGDVMPCPCFGPRMVPEGRLGHALMFGLCAGLVFASKRSLGISMPYVSKGAIS